MVNTVEKKYYWESIVHRPSPTAPRAQEPKRPTAHVPRPTALGSLTCTSTGSKVKVLVLRTSSTSTVVMHLLYYCTVLYSRSRLARHTHEHPKAYSEFSFTTTTTSCTVQLPVSFLRRFRQKQLTNNGKQHAVFNHIISLDECHDNLIQPK